jgi:hypothetical protein
MSWRRGFFIVWLGLGIVAIAIVGGSACFGDSISKRSPPAGASVPPNDLLDDFVSWEDRPLRPPASPSAHEDVVFYSEYVPDLGNPACDNPIRLDARIPNSTETTCLEMYKSDTFVESRCEDEALFKWRTNPKLLDQNDTKWISNVFNRKHACMTLLARKQKLSLWDTLSRWWSSDSFDKP